MERELKNGDLIRVKDSASVGEFKSMIGLIGIVIDDIDAHEEVQVYHAGQEDGLDFMWWEIDQVEAVNENR